MGIRLVSRQHAKGRSRSQFDLRRGRIWPRGASKSDAAHHQADQPANRRYPKPTSRRSRHQKFTELCRYRRAQRGVYPVRHERHGRSGQFILLIGNMLEGGRWEGELQDGTARQGRRHRPGSKRTIDFRTRYVQASDPSP